MSEIPLPVVQLEGYLLGTQSLDGLGKSVYNHLSIHPSIHTSTHAPIYPSKLSFTPSAYPLTHPLTHPSPTHFISTYYVSDIVLRIDIAVNEAANDP